MRVPFQYTARILAVAVSVLALQVVAQEPTVAQDSDKKIEAATNPNSEKKADVATATVKAQPAKKMVQDATINLQTTITGNQEQPRVLYILPWQSPQTANVDFESLDSQQQAVFSHVEREELRRELESAGELQ